MFETPFSVVGTVITDPIARRVGDQEFSRFRMASNSRKRTAEGGWEAGNTLYLTVNCWGKVAEGVAGVLFKGDPVVVVGQIYTNEYDDKEGNRRSTVEVRATSIGPDLSRCRAKLEKPKQAAGADRASEPEADDQTAEEPADKELTLSA